ncbi:MAG: hypothetical protein AABX85_03060 [Nanoarchaeota archaeon]
MNVKNLVLGIGIFVVFLLMLHFGIETFYASPKYEEFCKPGDIRGYYPEKGLAYPAYPINCTYSRQLMDQEQACYSQNGQPVYEYDQSGCSISVKECNLCNKYFMDEQAKHDRVVFVIALIIGIVVLFVGYGVLSVEPVGSSLMASGVGAIFYGSMRNWVNLTNVWRFLLLLLALILLIWIALRLNKNIKGNGKKRRR